MPLRPNFTTWRGSFQPDCSMNFVTGMRSVPASSALLIMAEAPSTALRSLGIFPSSK